MNRPNTNTYAPWGPFPLNLNLYAPPPKPTHANTQPPTPLSLLSIRVVCLKPQLQSSHPALSTVKFKAPAETHTVALRQAVGEVNSSLGL